MRNRVYIFCIDTDEYAGNFERPMCAFMTGVVGECGVGDEEAEAYLKEGLEPLEDLIMNMPDEHGCYRPAKIQPTPGWFGSGMSGPYREANYDEAKVVEEHNKAVEDYAKNTCEVVYADKAHGKAEGDRFRKEHTITKLVKKYPAYNSVGIFLSRKPTDEELAFLKKRAELYAKSPRAYGESDFVKPFKIDGFRLVTRKTTDEGEAV